MSDDKFEEVTFHVKCTMRKRWASQFLGMLKMMQYLGGIGGSREVTFYADGDGDYRPKFETTSDIKPKRGLGKENLFFDAG